jgi:hypothetical protein
MTNINAFSRLHIANTDLQRSDQFPLNTADVQPSQNTANLLDKVAMARLKQSSLALNEQDLDNLLKQQIKGQLQIAQVSAASPSYQISADQFAMRSVFKQQHIGLQQGQNADQLMQSLDNSVRNVRNAYGKTSELLQTLGQLGAGQRSFLARSEQRFEQGIKSKNPDFIGISALSGTAPAQSEEVDDNNKFELTIQTREGDVISINLSSALGFDGQTDQQYQSFQLDYQVEGSLSEQEYQAMVTVFSGIGQLADDFFSANGPAKNASLAPGSALAPQLNLDFLGDFDQQQLAGLDLSFSTSEHIYTSTMQHSLDFSYQFDQDQQTQHLALDWQAGMNREISVDLNMSTIGQHDQQQMAQYLRMMEENFVQSSPDQQKISKYALKSIFEPDQQIAKAGFSLFKSAFTSMSSQAALYTQTQQAGQEQSNYQANIANLSEQMIQQDPRYQGLSQAKADNFSQGFSKLADFDAGFSFTSAHPGDYTRLQFGQQTKVKAPEGQNYSAMTQDKTMQASSQFDYIQELDSHQKQESYQIKAGLDSGQMQGLDQQRQVTVEDINYQVFIDTKGELGLHQASKTNSNSNETSQIRLINDIWTEQNELNHSKTEENVVLEYGRQTATKFDHNVKHDMLLKVIGDLETYKGNTADSKEYYDKLNRLNAFMAKV